jgi:hypothetical protein
MIVILYVCIVLLATGATLLPCADEVTSSIHCRRKDRADACNSDNMEPQNM